MANWQLSNLGIADQYHMITSIVGSSVELTEVTYFCKGYR